jgi:hypothetical protein
MDSLIRQIRSRIADERPNDHPGEWLAVQQPVTASALADAQAQLGFDLPDLLRRLYLEVGNGGFGPVFGLIPLSAIGGLPPRAEFDLVGDYLRLVRRYARNPAGGWPVGLVPTFYCGCTVFEFVDCRDPVGPVTWFDEGSEKLAELMSEARPRLPSLKDRLEAWLAGKSVW